MLDWDKLKVFYNVVESGSFTQAATRLQIGQSAISRQISNLEDRMGVPLFHRHVRGLTLTEQGELLFRTTREVFADLAMTQARLTENAQVLRGSLKVAVTNGLGTAWVAPRIHKFLARYPDIRLTLRLSDDPVDLTVHESDVAITALVKEDDELIYRELLCRPLNVYSSPAYLFKFGIPLKPEDLDRHRLLVFSGKGMIPFDNVNWLLSCGTPPGVVREPYLAINNLYGIARAVEGGSGIACFPPYIAKKCKNIVQILPEVAAPSVRFYFVYSRQLKESKKIENLWNFLRKEVQKEEASLKRSFL
jgi:DNA-binding transcriptional LysR family regulator